MRHAVDHGQRRKSRGLLEGFALPVALRVAGGCWVSGCGSSGATPENMIAFRICWRKRARRKPRSARASVSTTASPLKGISKAPWCNHATSIGIRLAYGAGTSCTLWISQGARAQTARRIKLPSSCVIGACMEERPRSSSVRRTTRSLSAMPLVAST